MKNLAVLVGAVAVAVFATAAVTGNAGVNKTAREQATPTLQKQVNELRNELICLATASGNGVAAVEYQASGQSAEDPVNDRGVCGAIGVAPGGTKPAIGSMTQPFKQIVKRAFGK